MLLFIFYVDVFERISPLTPCSLSPEILDGVVRCSEPPAPPNAAELIEEMQAQPKPDVKGERKFAAGCAFHAIPLLTHTT